MSEKTQTPERQVLFDLEADSSNEAPFATPDPADPQSFSPDFAKNIEPPTLEEAVTGFTKERKEAAAPEGEGETKQAAETTETQETQEEQVLGDETKIQIGEDEEGKPIEATMKELVEGYNRVHDETAIEQTLGVKPVELPQEVKEFSIDKTEGWQDFEREQQQYKARMDEINARVTDARRTMAVLRQAQNPDADDFDLELNARNMAKVANLESEIAPLTSEWHLLDARSKESASQQAKRVFSTVENTLSQIWPEYANPATRQKAAQGLAAEVAAMYGEDQNELLNVIQRDPRASAMMLDALAYRKMAGGASKSGIGKTIESAMKKSGGSPKFVYGGQAKAAAGKRAPAGKSNTTVDAAAFDSDNFSKKQQEMLMGGDLQGLANSLPH